MLLLVPALACDLAPDLTTDDFGGGFLAGLLPFTSFFAAAFGGGAPRPGLATNQPSHPAINAQTSVRVLTIGV